MSPRVSVVIPIYNRGNVLPRAIASSPSQTFSDFELIVVDDGSTDHTTEVVRGIDDPRVRLVGDTTNRLLPWSRAYVLRAFASTILGPRARRAVAHMRAALARRFLPG